MATATKPTTATLKRIGISRRVQLQTDGRFFGELKQDDDRLLWSGRIWLPSHDDRPGRGSVVGEWATGDMAFDDLLKAAESCIEWHIDEPVKIERQIEADGYYSTTMLASYPHLASDCYLACAVYDPRDNWIVDVARPRVYVKIGPPLYRTRDFVSVCDEWRKSGVEDPVYLAWLVSERLKQNGGTPIWVKSLTR